MAVVGASERAGSIGNEVLVNLHKSGFQGEIFFVNPARDSIDGRPCYTSLSELPKVPQQVVFAIGNERLEACLDEAIALGIPAATVFSSLYLEDDTQPGLRERIRAKVAASGLLLHGGNCMGIYNIRDGVWLSGFDTRAHRAPGNVALLSQSGAGMSGILDCEERIEFCFAASTGQELCVSVEDYLDFVLDLPETRVVGLFLETCRHPQRFLAALEKARLRDIPIVVLKVGRTDLSAEMAVSHSGALVGSDAAYQAVFDRYGVQRVEDMAQLATTLMLFAQPRALGSGGLVTLHDSGGERQLLIDLAEQLEVSLADLSTETVEKLQCLLNGELPAVNPLDAWTGGSDAAEIMRECFTDLLADPAAALGAVVHDRAPVGELYPDYLDYLRSARQATGKPVFLVSNHAGSGGDARAVEATLAGMPVVDGLREFLVGVRCLLAYRDYQTSYKQARTNPENAGLLMPLPHKKRLDHWRELLSQPGSLDELQAGALLRDFGISIVEGVAVNSAEGLQAAMAGMSFPLVLKTAVPGIAHKSDVGGVCLNLTSPEQLSRAWEELASRLGPEAMLAPMVMGEGIEMILGIARDEQFGPLVVLGFGGIHAEVMSDVISLLPPFDADDARRSLDRLKMRALLGERRGRPALHVTEFCEMASRLSVLAVALSDCIDEVDINPVKLMAGDCIGLDALVVPRRVN